MQQKIDTDAAKVIIILILKVKGHSSGSGTDATENAWFVWDKKTEYLMDTCSTQKKLFRTSL